MRGEDYLNILSIGDRIRFEENYRNDEVNKFRTDSLEEYLVMEFEDLGEFLSASFNWEESEEGPGYWSTMEERYLKSRPGYTISQEKEENKENLPEKKVFISCGDRSYFTWLNDSKKYFFKQVKNVIEADILLLTGGEDVHYSFYANSDSEEFEGNHYNIERDMREILMYQTALSNNKKILGICRGAQLICTQTGGTLVQDMNHPSKHRIVDVLGNVVGVTSSHHQMAMPPSNANILGFTRLTGSSFHGKGYKNLEIDVENVWYPEENALGIQSHPEWQEKSERAYFIALIESFLADEGLFSNKEVKYTEEAILKDEKLMEVLDSVCRKKTSLRDSLEDSYRQHLLDMLDPNTKIELKVEELKIDLG